jgi:hypothetical protein
MKPLSPLKSIRAKCLECMSDSPKEVRNCTTTECPLFKFRMGTNPARAKIGPGRVIKSHSVTKRGDSIKDPMVNVLEEGLVQGAACNQG